MCMKFRTFWKKRWVSSLIISEIMDWNGYLNVVLLQNQRDNVPNAAEIS